ncbi:putative wall-associated receptor kinase-like 16 [Arachis stenosperma]|uniref:putative wall-associated receptor kinase-like 16 n=1 Tax=Arachis stenosperma TaxID=217475 RepID=UPI0025AC1969|nr:putative wall-associated receptor kinase-like 16 [Arachis stenosperma]
MTEEKKREREARVLLQGLLLSSMVESKVEVWNRGREEQQQRKKARLRIVISRKREEEGITIAILALVVASFYVHWTVDKTKVIKLQEHNFQQNVGSLLQEHIAKHSCSSQIDKVFTIEELRNATNNFDAGKILGPLHNCSSQITKVFTLEELRKATNNFDAGKILGQGNQGTVYKGVLSDDITVAIKKSNTNDTSLIELINKDFINELVVLSQINHRHVVKLLGCCLETESPLLVYEFIPNGTVYEHLHGHEPFLRLTWKTRLRIAAETAGALAHLHLDTCIPVIHKEVKTSNILLDHDLTANVSDFGASRIVPQGKTEVLTLLQGTWGYVDPESFLTKQFTDKSDVYGFGVVLAELLTGREAFSFDVPDAEKYLAMFFVTSMEENRLLDIVDKSIINEAKVEHVYEFAKIAKQCLSLKGEERPTMKEVAMELERIRAEEKHRWLWEKEKLSSEETEILVKAPFTSNNNAEESFMLLD